ncbi:unnamed protein product [Durusdinium trenchii]
MVVAFLSYFLLAAFLPSDGHALLALAVVPAPAILVAGSRGRSKALFSHIFAAGLCLVVGAIVGISGFLAPLIAGLPLRACWRVLGWSQEPLLQEIWCAPRRLVFAAFVGSTSSFLCFLWGVSSVERWQWRAEALLACNTLIFALLAAYSFCRFKCRFKAVAAESEEIEKPKASNVMSQSFHQIEVDGQEVTLRVFLPASGEDEDKEKPPRPPAVVMVCGLLWLGEGLLGFIGLNFNDAFGYAFARQGVPCVQIHTPQRHIANTRVMELALALCSPLYLVPGLRFLLLASDISMLLTSKKDLVLLLLAVVIPGIMDAVLATSLAVPMLLLGPLGWFMSIANMAAGLVIVPLLHCAVRLGQYLLGELDFDRHRNYLHEVEATVAWAEENQSLLGSDGRLVLCGYSSGGHVASLYGLEQCAVPKNGKRRFEAVVLVSGIYDLRTDSWQGVKRFLAPIHNMLYGDILAADSDEKRANASPVAILQKKGQAELDAACTWWVLNAKKELMGLPVLEKILFDSDGLTQGLKGKGATVKRVECGYNHWLLVFGFPTFATSFCESLLDQE